MFGSNSCFLTWIQISQEAGQVVWYSHLLKNFPQFLVIHTVEGFDIVSEAEVDVFLVFFCDPVMLTVWSLIPLPFLNPACTSGSSHLSYCWSLALEDFEHDLAIMWNECNCTVVLNILWCYSSLLFNENWFFQSCGRCWVFQICWHVACSTFIASSFRIWSRSAGIP